MRGLPTPPDDPVPGAPSMPVPKRTFASIQAGRGIAALLVVLYHGNKLVAGGTYWHPPVFGTFFRWGHAGVEFFFVLSGFIIAHVHARDIGRPARLGNYVARRFRRIYPLYWIVLGPMILLAVLPLGFTALPHVSAASLISSVLLVGPDSHSSVLAVAWTLYHEIFFYLGFALLILRFRLGIAFFAAWLALIGVAAVVGVPGLPPYVTSTLNLLFVVGAAAEVAVRRRLVTYPRVMAALGIAGFVVLGVEEVAVAALTPAVRDLLYGVTSAVGLAGVVSFERDHPLRVSRGLQTLGAASYSIYLTHYPLLSVVAKALARLGLVAAAPVEVGYVIMVATTVALGVVFHDQVERPLLARSPARARGHSGSPVPPG